jgi:demethylmacrocin O-methyltransferase
MANAHEVTESVTESAKRAGVKVVKPLVSDQVWDWMRDPLHRRPTPPPPPEPTLDERLAAMSLTDVARHFGTDKAGIHHYTPHYEHHLRHLKKKSFTLLEIGIGGYARERQGGRSLRMWKHYFPKANVVGLDIEDKSFVDEDRITTYQGSQVDRAVLERIVSEQGTPRVIIDDGSHRPEHIRETFSILFPLLADGGIYVIEDVQTSYWTSFGGAMDLDDPSTTMALVKGLLDGLNWEEWIEPGSGPSYSDLHVVGLHAYHNLVFLEKGTNQEGTNRKPRHRPPSGAEPAAQA